MADQANIIASVTPVAQAADKKPDTPLEEANKAPEANAELMNPLDETNENSSVSSDLIKNIVTTETSIGEENILGEAPELDASLLQDLTPPRSVFLLALKAIFAILVVSSIASFLFFTSQLSGNLDFVAQNFDAPNVSQELSASNQEVIQLQTSLNFSRYLKLKALFDQFSYDGDSYLHNYDVANSQTSTDSEKNTAKKELAGLKAKLGKTFTEISGLYAEPFVATLVDISYQDVSSLKTLFEEKLRFKFMQEANALANGANTQSKRDYRNYNQATNLVGNDALKVLIVNIDFEALDEKKLYDLIKDVQAKIVNDMTTIQGIKSQRIKWSDIINEIDLRTIAVDSHYNENYYDAFGGIRYISYDFDTLSKTISIVGETKRFDTTNFTMIANLIDELNRSDLFENGEMKTFNKSGSLEDGYVASLKLTLDIQGDEEVAEQDVSTAVDELPDFLQ